MIVANRKPFEEIVELIKPYRKILLLGCNECVTVCATGGAKEVEVLASELRMHREKEGQPIEVKEHVLERNCDPEYVEPWARHRMLRPSSPWPAAAAFSSWASITRTSAYCLRSTRPLTG